MEILYKYQLLKGIKANLIPAKNLVKLDKVNNTVILNKKLDKVETDFYAMKFEKLVTNFDLK